ncbi:MAG: epoxyqueuosine reductase QueH [Syntrophomonadaceae bacterium]|nr:epoxyqueuosine reductase QueH [Syntrophomonadaceae bacterium]
MNKVLLHICCGPCATYPVPFLQDKGYQVTGFFSNPNIHPYSEYAKRKEGLEKFAELTDLKVIYEPDYDPLGYFQNVSFRESNRCFYCYTMRLEQTARYARKGKFDYFTSTLLVSKYQKHDMIIQVAETMAAKYQVPFLYFDFREGFRETAVRAKEMGLYRQQYCGCLYSEVERYKPKIKKNLYE